MKRLTVEKLIDLLSVLSPSSPIKVLELEVIGNIYENPELLEV